MSYEKYYPGGWQSGESGGTPITPEALNHMENGIKKAYSDFAPAQEDASFPGCYYRMVNKKQEWINPPMVPGVEYRTTERSSGSAVYVKRIAYKLGAINASNAVVNSLVPHGISGFAYLVRTHCAKDSYVLPYLKDDGGFTSIASVDSANITVRAYKATWAEATWFFDLYYVKY